MNEMITARPEQGEPKKDITSPEEQQLYYELGNILATCKTLVTKLRVELEGDGHDDDEKNEEDHSRRGGDDLAGGSAEQRIAQSAGL